MSIVKLNASLIHWKNSHVSPTLDMVRWHNLIQEKLNFLQNNHFGVSLWLFLYFYISSSNEPNVGCLKTQKQEDPPFALVKTHLMKKQLCFSSLLGQYSTLLDNFPLELFQCKRYRGNCTGTWSPQFCVFLKKK